MKRKLWLLAVLVLCLTAATAVGCKKKQPAADSTVLLAGFESTEELLAINWQNMFGAVDLSDDAAYVTEGSHAAKLSVRGDYTAGRAARPNMTVYTDSKWLDKQDFTDTTKMTVDVFNVQTDVVNMYFQFAILNAQNAYQYSSEQKVELQAGMNHVELAFDRAFLNQLINIKNIARLVFSFDNETEKNQPARVLYMDNFRAHTTADPIPTDVKIRQEHEIESADRAEYISAWNIINYRFSPSELTHNTDPAFITQGTGSFKFSAPATGGGVTSPGIVLPEPAIKDISSYYSISFDIYNDNDKDFAFTTLTFKTFGVAKAKAWTRFEFTVEQLKTFEDEALLQLPGYDPSKNEHKYDIHDFKNFTLLTNNDSKDEPIAFYIDNFFANKTDVAKPTIAINGAYATEVTLGEAYTVPADVSVEKGTLDKWVILGPDGAQLGADNASSFTPAVKGNYTIVYTASNANGSVEYRLVVYAGLPPTITLAQPNVTVPAGVYTVPTPAVANGGVLSWKIYRMSDGVRTEQIGGENETSFAAEGGFYLVEYTAVNEEATRKAYHNVLVDGEDSRTRLQTVYPQLYAAEKATASVGSAGITAASAYTLGDDKAVRMSGSGTVQIEYAFGVDVGTAQTFGFAVYNPTDSDQSFTFGMATNYDLKAHSWLRFDLPTAWYRDWKCLNRETNILEKVNFSLSGDGAIDAYLTFFTLSPVQAGPTVTVGAYEDHMSELAAYTVPAAAASGGVAVTHKVFKQTGEDRTLFADDSPAAFTPDAAGMYKIEYSATNVFGTTVRAITVLFGNGPDIRLTFTDRRIDAGEYTVTAPTVDNADNVSWKVYQIFSNLLYGSSERVQQGGDSPTSFTALAGHSYVIEYTSTNSVATVTAVQRLAVEGGIRLEEKAPAAFTAASVTAETGTVQIAAENRLTDKTIKAAGTDEVNFVFEPDAYLSAGVTAAPFWVLNGSDGAVDLTISGSNAWSVPYTLQPGIWYRVDLPLASYLQVWGVVDQDNYLRHLGLRFTGTGALTVYADLFSVYTDEAVAFTVPTDIVTEFDVGEAYDVPAVTAKDGSTVTWAITDATDASVDAGWVTDTTFTPQAVGTYKITYTATNAYGTSTKVVTVKVIDSYALTLTLDNTHIRAAAGTYAIVPPKAYVQGEEVQANIDWTVEMFGRFLYQGSNPDTPLDGRPETLNLTDACSYKITFTGELNGRTDTVEQYVVCESGPLLATVDPDAFAIGNVSANAGTDVAIEEMLGGKVIRMTGENDIGFSFKPNSYLGGQPDHLVVWVYVTGESTKVNFGRGMAYGGHVDIEPGLWYRFDMKKDSQLRPWNIMNTGNVFEQLDMGVRGSGAITAYLAGITVYTSEAVGFVLPDFGDTDLELGAAYSIPTVTAQDGSTVTRKVTDAAGNDVDAAWLAGDVFTPQTVGTYKIVYTATNAYGTSTKEVTVSFTAADAPTLTIIDKHLRVQPGDYTVTPPVVNGATVTYTIEGAEGNYNARGSAQYTAVTPKEGDTYTLNPAWTYRITYTATNASGSATAVQHLVCEAGRQVETFAADKFTQSSLVTEEGTGSVASITSNGVSDCTVEVSGPRAKIHFRPGIDLAQDGSTLTNLVYWIYMEYDQADTVTVAYGGAGAGYGGPESGVPTGRWFRMDWPLDWIAGSWGCISGTELVELQLNVFSNDTGTITLYLDAITAYYSAA